MLRIVTRGRGIPGVPGSSFSTEIFDRHKERKAFSNILRSKTPELVVVTGPRDTGKTRLIESVMQETEKKDRFWWLHINMRDPVHHWTSVEAVYRSLLLTFTTAFYRYAVDAANTFLNSLRLSVPLGPTMSTANVSWRLPPEHHGMEGSFEEMLSAAEKVMIGMKHSLWSGQYYPVLSFDDVEKMYSYLDNDNYPEGKKVLEIIREFFVKNTKEQENFHIVVTSTSSVHVRRFLRDIDGRAEVLVIGDLGKEDAKVFWEKYLPENYLPTDNPSIPVPSLKFDDVYNVFGGHMFHLKQCYLRGVRPESTTIVKMALVRWKQFVVPTSGSKKFKWSRESAIAVMDQLRENGSIQYTALKNSFGEELVDEMVKEHFLVYQPLPSLVDNDVEDPSHYPILTAPSPAHLWTLRKYF